MAQTAIIPPTFRDPLLHDPSGGTRWDPQWVDWFNYIARVLASVGSGGGGGGGGVVLAAPSGTGYVIHLGGGTTINRQLVAGDNTVKIANPTGVSGNTSISVEAFPVGAVFLSFDGTDPATVLGYGTWVRFGQGRVLVGLDETNPWFDSPGETGGSYT